MVISMLIMKLSLQQYLISQLKYKKCHLLLSHLCFNETCKTFRNQGDILSYLNPFPKNCKVTALCSLK